MTRLVWNRPESRYFHAGLDRGVFYPPNGVGRAWDGLLSAYETRESHTGAVIFQDGIKIAERNSFEQYQGRVEALSYPEELDRNGYIFGFCYRTVHGEGYLIHVVYNVMASPTALSRLAEPGAHVTFGWDLYSTKRMLERGIRSSHLVIDTNAISPEALSQIEALLYGSDEENPSLPPYETIVDILESGATVRVTRYPDGSFTIEGPDDVVVDNGDGSFTVTWPSVILLDDGEYQISSL